MNAQVLFLVICLASAILYAARHLVIYKGLCVIFGRSRHEKNNNNKKERDPELLNSSHNTSMFITLWDVKEPTHLSQSVGRGVPGVLVWSLCALVWVGEVFQFQGSTVNGHPLLWQPFHNLLCDEANKIK